MRKNVLIMSTGTASELNRYLDNALNNKLQILVSPEELSSS